MTDTTLSSNKAAWLLPLVLAAGALVYLHTLSAPFIFDDTAAITANPHIKQLWPLTQSLTAPAQTSVAGRPVANLSLAINYTLGGLNVRGYHIFNLVLHLLSAALLFAIVRRTLSCKRFGDKYRDFADPLALIVTAIWTLHPLHTETIIYVIQRTELLMALFYLLTLYGSIRALTARRSWPWQALAVAACALGMASKEVMVSAPLAVLLYDRVFQYHSFRAAFRQRLLFYLALLLTWILLAALMISGPRSDSIGFAHGISAVDYLQTQAGVILRYLRLAFWPHPLSISYDDWPIIHSVTKALLPFTIITLLLGVSTWALLRRRPTGLLGLWFFMLLAPTSSCVPIISEIAAERRMYLPLIVPIVICVIACHRLLHRVGRNHSRRKWALGTVSVAIVTLLAGLTFARGRDYSSAISIWRDTVEKRPRNALAHTNLGNALYNSGDALDAIQQYETSLEIESDNARTHYNLANALAAQDRLIAAIEHYDAALRLTPDYPDAHYNRGIALSRLGRVDEAIAAFHATLELAPNHIGACNNLGLAHVQKQEYESALEAYRRALKIDENSTIARRNLADALLDLGRLEAAEVEYRRVLELNPEHVGAHCNLGIALALQNRRPEAIEQLRAALRLDPNNRGAQRALNDLSKP